MFCQNQPRFKPKDTIQLVLNTTLMFILVCKAMRHNPIAENAEQLLSISIQILIWTSILRNILKDACYEIRIWLRQCRFAVVNRDDDEESLLQDEDFDELPLKHTLPYLVAGPPGIPSTYEQWITCSRRATYERWLLYLNLNLEQIELEDTTILLKLKKSAQELLEKGHCLEEF